MNTLQNKNQGVAIITGGASGIGLAIAKGAVGEGWKVLLADLTQPALDAAKAQIDAIKPGVTRTVVMDVADEDMVIAGLKDCEAGFGPVRGLVNSAGIGRQVPFFETSVKLFREILDINLVGTFAVAKEAARMMKAHGGGAIVNVASVSGIRGNIERSAYGASKGGVINAIAPGPFETPMVQEMHTAATREAWMQVVPQRRYAEPDEVAGAALFLLDGSKSSFVTGHILNVDGGFAAHGLLPKLL
ncbi:MAG: SDR family NAD(P)-dependent oxidoreductase [Hyphomicrobiales bacterium]|nr:SDR family NAD(P)-dependent oxidoreductase [Hyphomicrobiales bacterium]